MIEVTAKHLLAIDQTSGMLRALFALSPIRLAALIRKSEYLKSGLENYVQMKSPHLVGKLGFRVNSDTLACGAGVSAGSYWRTSVAKGALKSSATVHLAAVCIAYGDVSKWDLHTAVKELQ